MLSKVNYRKNSIHPSFCTKQSNSPDHENDCCCVSHILYLSSVLMSGPLPSEGVLKTSPSKTANGLWLAPSFIFQWSESRSSDGLWIQKEGPIRNAVTEALVFWSLTWARCYWRRVDVRRIVIIVWANKDEQCHSFLQHCHNSCSGWHVIKCRCSEVMNPALVSARSSRTKSCNVKWVE